MNEHDLAARDERGRFVPVRRFTERSPDGHYYRQLAIGDKHSRVNVIVYVTREVVTLNFFGRLSGSVTWRRWKKR